MSDTPINRRLLGAAAAIIAGLPVAVAGFLRLKYGRTVFADLVAFQKEQQQKKEVEALVEQNFKVIDFFEAHVKQTPDKEFVLHKDELLTYGELDRQANQLAHFVQQSEVAACMETVAIFIRNEPSFVVSWLAFAKLGLRIALINYNLKGRGLLYSIKACNVKMIACGNGCDSRAGMAAVFFKEGHQLDPNAFYDHVVKSLPFTHVLSFFQSWKR